ncbi:MAG: hypothetical protein M3042_05110 [Actinomycetota bacterium]|nr:hypothetical protein [Actinomycetota bacterium]
MRLELSRTGGFAGRTVRWTLDTDELAADEAARIDALVAGARSWGGPPAEGADRFHYLLRISGTEDPIEVDFGEPGPPAAQPLLDRLRRTAPEPG